MKTTAITQSQDATVTVKPLTMFFDGAGCRPSGDGSGYAWLCPDNGQRHGAIFKGITRLARSLVLSVIPLYANLGW